MGRASPGGPMPSGTGMLAGWTFGDDSYARWISDSVQGFFASSLQGRSAGDMTRFAVEPGPALAVRRAGAWFVRGLLADAAVDPLSEQIGVAEVAGVLLDHVEYHLAARRLCRLA